MTRKLVLAVLATLVLETSLAGYAAAAAGQEARARCSQDHGTVLDGECVKAGQALFSVPL